MSNERMPDMTKPHMGTFKQWYPYKTDNVQGLGFRLHGIFHGHERFHGASGHTSEIIAVFPELNMVETRNSRYTLEQPSIAEVIKDGIYNKWFAI